MNIVLSIAFLMLATTVVDVKAEDPTLVKVKTPAGSGTGFIVRILEDKPIADGYEGYLLTAYHVVSKSAKSRERDIEAEFPNGRISKNCKVVASDIKNDIALVWIWVPGDLKEIEISSRPAQYGDDIIFHGLGGGIDVTKEDEARRIPGKASAPTRDDNIYCDVVLIPGDSGGPVTLDGKLVGTISGGWFWFKKETGEIDEETQKKKKQKVTWPASACGLGPIKELLKSLDVGKPTPDG